MRLAAMLLASLLGLAACSLRQHLNTGEPLVFALEPRSGAMVDRDVLGPRVRANDPALQVDPPAIVPHKGEIVAIVVNNVFLRYLQALTSPHVLNLPILSPDDAEQMKVLRGLDKTAFAAIPGRPGLFNLSDTALAALAKTRKA